MDQTTSISSIIVLGIGGKLGFENPLQPTLDNPTVWQDAIRVVFEAARTLGPANKEAAGEHNRKSVLAVLSTTGISEIRDLPFLMMPMYKWMLEVPSNVCGTQRFASMLRRLCLPLSNPCIN